MRRKFAFNLHDEHTRLYSVYKAIGQHLLIKKCCSSCPTPVFNKLNSVWLNTVTFTLLGGARLNYMGCTTPFTELARRMPWVAHKICVVFRCVYIIRRAGPLAEIPARATGFFCLTLLANQREKLPFFCKYRWKVNVCLDEWALAHTLPLFQSRQFSP